LGDDAASEENQFTATITEKFNFPRPLRCVVCRQRRREELHAAAGDWPNFLKTSTWDVVQIAACRLRLGCTERRKQESAEAGENSICVFFLLQLDVWQ